MRQGNRHHRPHRGHHVPDGRDRGPGPLSGERTSGAYPARDTYLVADKAAHFAQGRSQNARARARDAAERACVGRALSDAGFPASRAALLLDMPCGAGRYLTQLGEGARRVVGADISPAMIAAALAAEPGARLFVAEGERLPLADGAVDAIATLRMLHHLPAPSARVRWLSELRRVCAPDGALVGTFIQARSPHHLTRALKRLFGGADPHRYAHTSAMLRSELAAAGWRLAGLYPTRGWWSETWVFRAATQKN